MTKNIFWNVLLYYQEKVLGEKKKDDGTWRLRPETFMTIQSGWGKLKATNNIHSFFFLQIGAKLQK